jgi:hypothetical protein
VLGKFVDLDLHPATVPNHAMGYVFEELLRRFSERMRWTWSSVSAVADVVDAAMRAPEVEPVGDHV